MINNNAHSNQNEVVQDALQANDFGAVLKKAREAAGLSVDDVAQKLIVSVDIIKAIDNSQAAALPALTFTQGYIRSYARMFDLSADEIIDAYNSVVPETKKVTTPQSVLLVHKTGSDALIKFITFGFMIVAIIALFAWLYQTDFRIKLSGQSAESAMNVSIDTSLADQSNSQQVEQLIQAPKPQLTYRSEQQQEQAVIENATDFNESQTQADVAIQQKAADIADSTVDNKPQTIPQPSAHTESLQTNASVNEIIATDELLLSATDDSWCEIHDANGQRLFYRLLSQGDEINVKGVAPFRVFLGNATQVSVKVNQNSVSFEHLINRNSKIANLNIESDAQVARFYNR